MEVKHEAGTQGRAYSYTKQHNKQARRLQHNSFTFNALGLPG